MDALGEADDGGEAHGRDQEPQRDALDQRLDANLLQDVHGEPRADQEQGQREAFHGGRRDHASGRVAPGAVVDRIFPTLRLRAIDAVGDDRLGFQRGPAADADALALAGEEVEPAVRKAQVGIESQRDGVRGLVRL